MNVFIRPSSLLSIFILSILVGCSSNPPQKEIVGSERIGSEKIESEKIESEKIESEKIESEKWESAIHQFEEEDEIWTVKPGSTLFVGSSSIRLWSTISQDFYPHPVINRGFGGAQTSDVLRYMERIVLPYKPANIILYAGGNDVAAGQDPESALKKLKEFVSRVHAELPKTRIFVLSLKPTIARLEQWSVLVSANAVRQAYTEKTDNVEYIDVASAMFDPQGRLRRDIFISDNLHMNATGYALWVDAIKQATIWE